MSYQRLYPQRINWEDEPSLATPINQVNLNKMDSALYGIDGRVVELDEGKVGKTETFNTSRNGVVPKPTQADITNEKVLRADGVWVEQSGGGGGGGGHTIVNNAGTSLQQRGKLKTVGGLNASDDSENNTTKITDEYEVIPWATWQGYTDAQKAQHPNAIITDAPDCDGTLEIENKHVAWTNPNPSASSTFSAQSVTLDASDYDAIRVAAMVGAGYSQQVEVEISKAGTYSYGILSVAWASYGANANFSRSVTWNGNTVSFDSAYQTGTQTASDQFIIPLYVYGIKNDLTAKIKAIAHDVLTDASKCILTSGNNVQDILEGTITVVADGTKTYAQGLNELFALIDSTKISGRSYLQNGTEIYHAYQVSSSGYIFNIAMINASNTYTIYQFLARASNSLFFRLLNGSIGDLSSNAMTGDLVLHY